MDIIVKKFLTHLQHRDLKNIMALFADNVKWEIPGNESAIAWLGRRNNQSEVETFFKLLWEATEPVSAEIHKILFDPTDAIVKGVFTTRMLTTGNIVTSVFFIHFVVREGLIVEYTLLEDSYAVSRSLTESF